MQAPVFGNGMNNRANTRAETNNSRRANGWVATVWEVDIFNRDFEYLITDGLCQYVLIGKEICPNTGREHLHIYVEYEGNRQYNWKKIRDIFMSDNMWQQPRRMSAKNVIQYIKKDGNWKEWGEPHQQGRRTDVEEVRELLEQGHEALDIASMDFGFWLRNYRAMDTYVQRLAQRELRRIRVRDLQCIVYIGPAGSGKSHHCVNWPGIDEDGTNFYRFPVQQTGKIYFDGFERKHSIMWIDEFNGSVMAFGYFCTIVDKYVAIVEKKGGTATTAGLKTVLISTTEYPNTWWKCESFRRDPNQLWRRITAVYYVPKSEIINGERRYFRPLLVNRDQIPNFDDNIAQMYEDLKGNNYYYNVCNKHKKIRTQNVE